METERIELLDGGKIMAWVEFGQAMIAGAIAGPVRFLGSPVTSELLTRLRSVGLSEETFNYLLSRASRFATQAAAAATRRARR